MSRYTSLRIKKQPDGRSASPIPIYDDDEYMEKNKQIVQIDGDIEVVLIITIYGAQGIDKKNKYRSVTNRHYYRVFGYVEKEDDEEFYTGVEQGLPNPRWNTRFEVSLDSMLMSRFVHLEVVRYFSESDPGPSSGIVLVGRTQVPIPAEFDRRTGKQWYELVRFVDGDGYRAEGHIQLQLEKKVVVKKRSRRFN